MLHGSNFLMMVAPLCLLAVVYASGVKSFPQWMALQRRLTPHAPRGHEGHVRCCGFTVKFRIRISFFPKEDSQCRLKKKVGECEFPRRHSCVVERVCSSSLFAKHLTI